MAQSLKVDLNRPMTIREHSSGMKICMYHDEPGQYVDITGQPISSALAKSAGFKVEADQRAAQKAKALTDFKKRLEREFEEEQDKLARIASEGGESSLEIRPLPGAKDRYAIWNKITGDRVTLHALTLDEARGIFTELSNAPVREAADPLVE